MTAKIYSALTTVAKYSWNYVNACGVNIVSQSCDHTVQIVCV